MKLEQLGMSLSSKNFKLFFKGTSSGKIFKCLAKLCNTVYFLKSFIYFFCTSIKQLNVKFSKNLTHM